MKKEQVTLSVKFKAKAGQGNRLKEAAIALIIPTRKESGCIDYYFHVNESVPDVFFFYENWISQQALDEHAKTPHIEVFKKVLNEVLAQEPEFTLWKVQE